jgi:hypothetical protein
MAIASSAAALQIRKGENPQFLIGAIMPVSDDIRIAKFPFIHRACGFPERIPS